MKALHIFLACVVGMVFGACANKYQKTLSREYENLAQDASIYVEDNYINLWRENGFLQSLKKNYLENFFAPWNEEPNTDIEEVFWAKNMLENNSVASKYNFGMNLQKMDEAFTKDMLDRMQIDTYPSRRDKAIITTTTHVRAVPSLKPNFSKSNSYPFDNWQNSLIFAGTPVLITHIDRSGRFLHIQSAFVSGWVDSINVGTLNNAQIKEIQKIQKYVLPRKDEIYLAKSPNIIKARIGQLFGVNNKNELMIFLRDEKGGAKISYIKYRAQDFVDFPHNLDQEFIANIANQLLGREYGWGGMYEERDCSSLVRDIFAYNAIFLPRNSSAQGSYRQNYTDLRELEPKQKEEFIIRNATPFYTILNKKGHVMIYLGEYDNKAIILHNVWSLNVGKKPHIFGKVVITTMHFDTKSKKPKSRKTMRLLETIDSMSDISAMAEDIASEEASQENAKSAPKNSSQKSKNTQQ